MYVLEYEKYLQPLKDQPINLLEVGIWKGTSVSAFHDYLPNATIYGIDIFTRVSASDIPALKQDRVKWIKGDSTKEEIVGNIRKNWGDVKFDVIIDDGLHTPEANAKTFKNIIPFLASGGVFYIEDVWPLDIMTAEQWDHSWIKRNKDKYNMDKWRVFADAIRGFDIQKIDLREQSNMPDSYIYKITK